MISFCLIKAGSRSEFAAQAVIHYVESQFAEHVHHFDRVHVDSEEMEFIGIRPASGNPEVDVSCFVDNRTIGCFYGELDSHYDRPAKRISEIYQSQGVAGLAELDGCYGATVYDRESKELVLGGDAIGQRCLRFVLQDDLVLISPHDIILAATGLVPITIDPVSVAAIGFFGWSVADASLIGAIRSVPPGSLITLHEGASPRERPHPFFAACERRRGSVEELSEIRERMIESVRDYLARRVSHLPTLDVELSAGIDSRAALATAISVVDRGRLNSFSDGTPDSIDVTIGRRVAERLGIAHRGGLPAEHSLEERHRYVDILALETNGDANALIGMTNRIAPPPPSLCGDGGEVFRGFFYPRFRSVDRGPTSAAVIAAAFWKWSRSDRSSLHPEVKQGICKRIASRAEWLAGMAGSNIDSQDLLYILERFAIMNQKLRRMTNAFNRRSPFYSRAAIRHFMTLPAPRGEHAQLHQMLIQRYAPKTLSIPINGLLRLNLQLGNAFQRRLGKLLVSSAKISRRLARRIGLRTKHATDLDQLRTQRFQHFLAGRWANLLLAKESGSLAALRREAVESLLADARANDRSAVKAVGALVTAELFLVHARRAHAMGQAQFPGSSKAIRQVTGAAS